MAKKSHNEYWQAKERERKCRTKAKAPMPLWWLRQRDPIARYTLWVALFTLALVAVGVLTWCTLQITDETQRANERAFVTFKDMRVTTKYGADKKVEGWLLEPIFENTGNTPTENLRMMGGTTAGGSEDNPSDPEDFYNAVKAEGGHFYIGPKAIIPFHLIGGGVSADWDEHRRASVAGLIYYNDVFPGSPLHVTKFCFIIHLSKIEGGESKPVWDLCPHWNCMDNECQKDRKDYEKNQGDRKRR